jgi:hypothetical protein
MLSLTHNTIAQLRDDLKAAADEAQRLECALEGVLILLRESRSIPHPSPATEDPIPDGRRAEVVSIDRGRKGPTGAKSHCA